MVRTRVGYAGGDSPNPTYHELGDHTETLDLDFDPQVIAFSQLLDVFWKSHNPCAHPRSRQYMSALFYHGEAQLRSAEESAAQIAVERGEPVRTVISPCKRFYLAEDYHQKYRLRGHADIAASLLEVYPNPVDLVNSTAATRLNGYVARHGSRADLERDLPLTGMSETAQARLLGMFDDTRG